MRLLFESDGDIFGTNKELMDSIPVKYLPKELRFATLDVPTKSCPFTLTLPDGRPGTFYYSPEKKFMAITASEAHIGRDGNPDSAKILVFLGNLDLMDKNFRSSKYVFYERYADDTNIKVRSKETNSKEFSLASNYARNCIKQISSMSDYDKAFKKLTALRKKTVDWVDTRR